MENNFTDIEKKFLVLLFKIGYNILDAQDGFMSIDNEYFSRNELYELTEKLGIDYGNLYI